MADITELANGLRFPEGPIAMPDGSVILVEIDRQTLSRVRPNGAVSVATPRPGAALSAPMSPVRVWRYLSGEDPGYDERSRTL